ncbi:PREDICTED: inhibin alpha chain, partial [Buceros rhinoceros silvestris]|uniref:inhibin alpha chain n=1 Tax=Buceros rhinoceros silvestris TaxID=175836 RepID=UPI000528A46F
LDKVRARVLEHLSPPLLQEEPQKEMRRVHRRDVIENTEVEPEEMEDTSQVILFPSTDVPCKPTQLDKLLEEEGIFTYLFQPSAHTLSRTVTSAKLWFYTGPSSFVFHYCHGSVAEGHGLSHRLGVQLCCAALPGTMRSLRVRTTSDGGYSFKYETVPNILAQDCTCV